jgi:hypothetical protein
LTKTFQRSSQTHSSGTLVNEDNSDLISEQSFDDDELEMKSVHSLDTRTFITEPKFSNKTGGATGAARELGRIRDSKSSKDSDAPGW